jgi:hypothetical protein
MKRLISLVAALCTSQAFALGVADKNVKQDNIYTTICAHASWAKKNRAPNSYTDRIKQEQFKAKKLKGHYKDYILDHWLSVSLGGDVMARNNLVIMTPQDDRFKNGLERRIKKQVCQKKLTLVDAQQLFLKCSSVACLKQIEK